MLKKVGISLIAFLFVCSALFGQTALTTTTLSAALTATQRSFNLASGTGVTDPGNLISTSGIGNPSGTAVTLLVVDKEVMRVNSVSSTLVSVSRGYAGSRSAPHVSGAKVYLGPAGAFAQQEPTGSCTRTMLSYVPIVVLNTGTVFDCVNGQYASFTTGPLVEGATLASADTIAPIGRQTVVSGTTAINTITAPPAMPAAGCLILIPSGLWSTGTSGNIAIATTGVVSKALTLCYSPTVGKWVPSY